MHTADTDPVLLTGPGDQPILTLANAAGARATIHLNGGHLTSWITPDGREQIYMSQSAIYAPGKALRGGVPVCFPQFAEQGPLPPHGFARTQRWQLAGSGPGFGRVELTGSESTRALWPHAFRLTLDVHLVGAALRLTLRAENRGESPFTFTAALHTYLRVDEIAAVQIEGLAGLRLRDKAAGGVEDVAPQRPLRIDGEVDRIYFGVPGAVRVLESGHARSVRQRGITDCVIWNPGPDRSRALPDLDVEGYRRMICVEAAALEPRPTLAPGAAWEGVQEITIDDTAS